MEKNKQGFLYQFNGFTSKHGTDWFLALTWIFVFEIISSIIEYKFLDYSRTYVIDIQAGVFKELLIAVFVSFFVWHFVYSIIEMQKNQFYFLVMYVALIAYFVVTNDITFNLLFHNIINPFEYEINGFTPYTAVQIFIKIIMLYLFFMMFKGLRHKFSK
ncbi:hypothetical protein [Arcobacter roscoffensis]|uniref:DUF2569 domain-containing protein n=1 Tax=Arcobacter roscoffensis TaxID=2961520 RepID=A0ABY5E5L9_9BACT|nr:hypothetical protein [Arcobacter roscoffensis]UTJ07026.1 hypothetical protein NJU99_02720 [Arcobacter roscoffensis]